jgi:hypothetical protein
VKAHFAVATCLGALIAAASAAGAPGADLRASRQAVVAAGHHFTVNVLRVRPLGARFKLGLAQGRVGPVEALDAIARRYGAAAGINGSFFDAYEKGPLQQPNHTLITDGHVVEKGNIGTLIGFTSAGRPVMGRAPLRIEGALDGRYRWPDNWWVYWIDRLPSTPDTVNVFTPYWGPATALTDGTQVTVQRGRVVGVARGGSQPIPRDGYVIYLRGREAEELAPRFRVGRGCEYRVELDGRHDLGNWSQVREAVGAGPRLLTDGRVTVDPVAEGFSHEKIRSLSGARSMVGITRDGWLIMATSAGTVRQMADVMKALGAWNAMNLDGGASSGLWSRGSYLRTPGRPISNALLVLDK